MYHVGLVQHIIAPSVKGVVSSDASVQVVVRMWDENLLILEVDKKIGKIVKKGDYALADYTPLSANSNHRKLSITKILPLDVGSKVWAEFQDELMRRQSRVQHAPQQPVRYMR